MNSFQAGQFYPERMKLPVRSYILECLPAALRGEKFIARPGGIAHVQSQFKPFNKLMYWLEKWAYSKADYIVLGSVTEKEKFLNQFGFMIPQLVVIPTGVPKQKFTPSDKKVVVWVGRLKKVKRPELVLEVARLLPDFTFLVYGEGYLEKKLLRERPSNVLMMGQAKPNAAYKEASVFLNTSEYEGTPRALLEAASFGKSIVTTDIGCFVDGQLQVESVENLVWGIKNAYGDRLEYGKCAWKFVRKVNSVEMNKAGWKILNRVD